MSRGLKGFGDLPHTHARGAAGEEAAEGFLRLSGYRIVARNVRTKGGELDMVALDGETLCFIEVKTRATQEFGRAIESVGPQKQRRLAKAALLFLTRNRSQRPCRFDVLGLDRARDGSWSFTLIKNAFDAPVLQP
ncbi:MAG: YraN family protein [Thermoanaerobaculia bacterium]